MEFNNFFDDIFSEEHRIFRQSIRRFVETEITPYSHAWEEAGEFPRELYNKAGEIGFLGASFPEELGGSAGDLLYAVIGIEEMMRGGSTGVSVGLGSHAIGLPPILFLGTEEQKRRFIPAVLSGTRIAALGVTEPGAGSDVAGVRTSARREGEYYILNGAKTFITSGVRADQVTVLARTGEDAHGGLTFFVIEKGMPGYSVSRALKKTGWWASDTGELAFADVRVPVANRLGEEGSGFVAVMQNFQNERLALAAYGYATAERALELAAAYTKERKAFGRTLSGFQVTRHKLADMATQVHAAKAFTYQVARRMMRGDSVVKEVSMAKNFAAEAAQKVCWEAVQLLGGMGYMRESEVERLYRDVRLLPIGGGTSEIMREIISKMYGF